MAISRRGFVAGLAAAAAVQPEAGTAPRARTGPVLCLDTRLLPDVDYSQLGTFLNGLGLDGCDLSVEPGGTVLPEQSPVDLVRAIEVISGEGFEVPVITTSFFSILEPWARNVLGLSGRSGVTYFRTGYSRFPERLAARRNEIAGLMSYGRAAEIGMAVPYPAGEALIRDLDPEWIGYDFDTTQGSVEAVLPRLRMVRLRDARKDGNRLVACPLGEGAVDWTAFFGSLARARFSGPLSVTLTYQAADRLDALKRDTAFARQQLNAAYQKELEPTSPRPSGGSPAARSRA
jgi:L-ribulose-5-phosphate 3-epimerase